MTAEIYTVVLTPRRIAYYARCVECGWAGTEHTFDRNTPRDSADLGPEMMALAEKDLGDHNDRVHPRNPEPSIASLMDWLNRTTFSPEDAEVLRRIIAERTVEREFEAHVRIRGTSIEVGMMTPAGAGEIDARTFANRVLGRSERVLTMEPGGATGVWRGEIIEGDA